MGEFIIGVFNTSLVMGLSIVAAGILLRVSRKRYSARYRKRIWIFMGLCLLIPFHLFRFPGAYTAEVPDLVLREFDGRTANGAGGQGITNGIWQSEQDQIAQNQPVQTAQNQPAQNPAQNSVQGASKTELTVADVLFAVWACVSVLLAAYFAVGYRRMRSKIRRWSSECGDGHVQEVVREIAAQCKLKRIPEVRIMKDSEEGPFTTGVLKNIIILPDDALHERDLRFILKHEMIHCRNNDILWRLFFLAVNVIHWFNPLVWYLRRTVEQDMEIACDEEVVVLASREDRKEYGDVIMSWVERSSYKGSAVSTGYVSGVKFLKRRFDSIFNGGKKKNSILLAGGVCVLALFIGCVIQLQSGDTVYAKKKIAIDRGQEVKTDLDGDGKTERVFVTDTVAGDNAWTQLCAVFGNGETALVNYPDYWASYLVTGDLTGNGAADIVLVKIAYLGMHSTGDVIVMHVEMDETGKPEFVEYPRNLIPNPDVEPKWIGAWEDYPYPDVYSEIKNIFAEQPVIFGEDCFGAAIIEKDGKTMLRVIELADPQTDSARCIDCSYTTEGWYIEDIQMIYEYYSGWEEKLLGGSAEPEGVSGVNPGGEIIDVPEAGDGNIDISMQESPVRMQVFAPEDVKATPEIVQYDYESARKMGEVSQLHGILPGQDQGTWYTIAIDGVEYYYGRYDFSPDRTELFGYAIVSGEHPLANGISVGMTKSELLERYPDLRIEDTEGNVLKGIGDWRWWNHAAYPRSRKGMDEDWDYGGAEYYYWESQFDYIMIADIEQPLDTPPVSIALMMKDDAVSAITFYYPTAD